MNKIDSAVEYLYKNTGLGEIALKLASDDVDKAKSLIKIATTGTLILVGATGAVLAYKGIKVVLSKSELGRSILEYATDIKDKVINHISDNKGKYLLLTIGLGAVGGYIAYRNWDKLKAQLANFLVVGADPDTAYMNQAENFELVDMKPADLERLYELVRHYRYYNREEESRTKTMKLIALSHRHDEAIDAYVRVMTNEPKPETREEDNLRMIKLLEASIYD